MRPPQPIALSDLILSRLVLADTEGLTKSALKDAVKTITANQLSASALTERLENVLVQLRDKGYAESVGIARYQATEKGFKHILDQLKLGMLPTKLQWATLKNTDWIACALGLPALTKETRKRLSSADGLRAAILQSSFDLPIEAFSTLTKTRNALLWQQLCNPTVTKDLQEHLPQLNQSAFNQGAIMGLLLNNLLQTPKPLKWDKALKQLVAKVANAKRTDPNELRLAVLRRALTGVSPEPSDAEVPAIAEVPTSSDDPPQLSVEAFATAALSAARATQEGRFGENKVFISRAWKALSSQHPDWHLTLEAFKQRLLEASRQDLISISCADLAYSLDSEDVAASELIYLQSPFHFIRID